MSVTDAYPLHKMHAVNPPEKAWAQFASLFDLTPLNMANNSGEMESHTWIAGACIFSQVSLDGNAHKHAEQHLETSGHLLFVHRYVAGGADGSSGAVPYMMRPGMMIFHDYGRPFEGIQTPSLIQSLHIPHDMIGYDPNTMPPQIILDQKSPHGAALFAAFDVLIPDLFAGRDHLEKQRTREFADVIRAALPKPDAGLSIQLQIQIFIEDNLKDPDLNLERVQNAFQLSRAQMFEEMAIYGGIETYIAVRRTYHAVLDLVEHPEKRARLDRTALSWGFPSTASLNRAIAQFYKADLNTLF